MSPDLPPALRAAIEGALDRTPRAALAERARRTSLAYRDGKPSSGVIRQADDALAYAVTRLPATYAACVTVFAEAARLAPGFRPASLLDAGAGTGAASWAAEAVWPGMSRIDWLDSSPVFLALAARLAEGGADALRAAGQIRADMAGAQGAGNSDWPTADLVVASYALAEIPQERQQQVVDRLWSASAGLMALVEPGTPAGYARILAARQALLAAGATILAPCPHDADCPLTGSDWCHFSVRLPRSRDHRLAKGAEVPFEDERFSYLIAARPGVAVAPRTARILAPPRSGKPGVEFRLCGPLGLEQRFVGKRDKAAFGAVRRLGWGDALD